MLQRKSTKEQYPGTGVENIFSCPTPRLSEVTVAHTIAILKYSERKAA